MWIGWLEFDLLLGDVHSLKQKRSVIRPIVAELHRKFGVSAAETGSHDLHRRTGIGLAVVSGDRAHVVDVLDAAERLVAAAPRSTCSRRDADWRTATTEVPILRMGVGACCPACGTQLRVAAGSVTDAARAVRRRHGGVRRSTGVGGSRGVRACLAALAIQGVEDVGVRLRVGLNSVRS